MRLFATRTAALSALLLAALSLSPAPAQAPRAAPSPQPVRIVAIGASNTHGFYIGKEAAYPALLEALLRGKGVNAQVINAGVPFDTTGAMRRRLLKDVPDGTALVILHPGGNDRRFFVSPQRRATNIAAMALHLRERNIKVVIYDDEIPARYYTFDAIHLTREGHAMIAAALLPRVLAALNQKAGR